MLRVIERLMGQALWPEGTKRHTVVHAVINLRQTMATGGQMFKSDGLRGVAELIKSRLRHGNVAPASVPIHMPVELIRTVSQLEFPPSADLSSFEIDSGCSIATASVGVSIIIPVLNGAHELLKLLPTLYAQKGFQTIEVIIVDSGSSDDTVAIGREYRATVVSIPANEFSHSGSRNLGASKATQEILVFMTVDALPPSDTWLHELFQFHLSNDVAAVSCREIPRFDADLFTRVESWHHYNVILDLGGRDRVLVMPQTTDPASLRRSAQLSDVSCLIPRELFLRYGFRQEYAEDLDLGLRLIRDGHRLGLLNATVIIHSHTRRPGYYLKRGYIDKLVIAKILGEPADASGADLQDVVRDLHYALNALSVLFAESPLAAKKQMRCDEFCRGVRERLAILSLASDEGKFPVRDHRFLDDDLVSFLESLRHTRPLPDQCQGPLVLLPGIEAFHEIAFRYMAGTYDLIDAFIAEDFQKLTYNYLMNLFGRSLAACNQRGNPVEDQALRAVDIAIRRLN